MSPPSSRPWSTDLDCDHCGAKAPNPCLRRDERTNSMVPKTNACWQRVEKAKKFRASGEPVPIPRRRPRRPAPCYAASFDYAENESTEPPAPAQFHCAQCSKVERFSSCAPEEHEDSAWIVVCPNGQAYGMVVVCSIKCAADYFANRLKQLETQCEHQRSS